MIFVIVFYVWYNVLWVLNDIFLYFFCIKLFFIDKFDVWKIIFFKVNLKRNLNIFLFLYIIFIFVCILLLVFIENCFFKEMINGSYFKL